MTPAGARNLPVDDPVVGAVATRVALDAPAPRSRRPHLHGQLAIPRHLREAFDRRHDLVAVVLRRGVAVGEDQVGATGLVVDLELAVSKPSSEVLSASARYQPCRP